jgi:hypothetical protein
VPGPEIREMERRAKGRERALSEAVGTVVSRPFAGSRFHRPAVQLEKEDAWYWIDPPVDGGAWPFNPGDRVLVRYVEGDQFCKFVAKVGPAFPPVVS